MTVIYNCYITGYKTNIYDCYITVIWCQTSGNSYITCYITVIFCFLSQVYDNITVI